MLESHSKSIIQMFNACAYRTRIYLIINHCNTSSVITL